MSVIEERLPLLDRFELKHGSHKPNEPNGGFDACAMEAAAYLAGEPWTDHPQCVSPVIGAFLRSWNDSLDDTDRQMLKPLIPLVIGTATGKRDEETRAWMATDWLARECAPAWLRLAGLTGQAEALEKLAPLVNAESARKAQPALDSARTDSYYAAWDAAGDAARGAAGAAAWVAAWAAAGAAAWVAAGVAAGDAAGDAAWAAAWAAAWVAAGVALDPTVEILQRSALLLVERMCEVGRA